MTSIGKTISILFIDSLFSTIITLYTLILLYFPSLFIQIVFSPTLILTIILVFFILRLGKTQCSSTQENEFDSSQLNSSTILSEDHKAEPELSSSCEPDPELSSNSFHADSFLEWDVKAPLEVIYEEREGEEAEQNGGVCEENRKYEMNIIQRYSSLSLFYPGSDSDDSSEGDYPTTGDWNSVENVFSPWEEEDGGGEGLIEIALNDRKRCSESDEDNLIEIDLSPAI